MKLLNISLPNALSIWSELEAAYYGDNKYGGTTAEIYAYRIKELSGLAYMFQQGNSRSELARQAFEEEVHETGAILHALLKEFQKSHTCRITVDGKGMTRLLHYGLVHRCHIEIKTVDPIAVKMRKAARS
jgi:hypothetical protein